MDVDRETWQPSHYIKQKSKTNSATIFLKLCDYVKKIEITIFLKCGLAYFPYRMVGFPVDMASHDRESTGVEVHDSNWVVADGCRRIALGGDVRGRREMIELVRDLHRAGWEEKVKKRDAREEMRMERTSGAWAHDGTHPTGGNPGHPTQIVSLFTDHYLHM